MCRNNNKKNYEEIVANVKPIDKCTLGYETED